MSWQKVKAPQWLQVGDTLFHVVAAFKPSRAKVISGPVRFTPKRGKKSSSAKRRRI
jgi:hypothetical protein